MSYKSRHLSGLVRPEMRSDRHTDPAIRDCLTPLSHIQDTSHVMRFSIVASTVLLALAGTTTAAALSQTPQQAPQQPAPAVAQGSGDSTEVAPASTTISSTTAGATDGSDSQYADWYQWVTRVTPPPEPSADCQYRGKYVSPEGDPISAGVNYFDVAVYNWPANPRGCGRGVLDNVRGKTTSAEATYWSCRSQSHLFDSDFFMSFGVSIVYRDAGARVAEAVRLASPGQNVTVDCVYHDH